MPDKEGWPSTPEEQRDWDKDRRIFELTNRQLNAPVLSELLAWLAMRGYVLCREDNSGGTFSQAWERADMSKVYPLLKQWTEGYTTVNGVLEKKHHGRSIPCL